MDTDKSSVVVAEFVGWGWIMLRLRGRGGRGGGCLLQINK
jgi:hypothetical protein